MLQELSSTSKPVRFLHLSFPTVSSRLTPTPSPLFRVVVTFVEMWGSESSSRTAGCFPRRWHDGSKEEAFDKAERLDLEKERAATTTEQPKARESMRMGEREEKGDAFEEIKGEGGERDNPVAREGDEERERDDAERRENGKMVLEGPR